MLRYHGQFNRDQFLLSPLNESLLKARETLNFEFVCWTNEVVKYLSRVRKKPSHSCIFSLSFTQRAQLGPWRQRSLVSPRPQSCSHETGENYFEYNRLLCSLEWLILTVRGQAQKHEKISSFRTWENLLSSETCSQELPQKKSFLPLHHRFMVGVSPSMFCCNAISRTLTCFPFWSPVIFVLRCGIIKRFKVWIVSNSSLKVYFTFISRWQRPWKTLKMHLKWTWINPFFCIF